MKTKMVFSDFQESFSRFFQLLRLNENENIYQKIKNENDRKIWK
jgi:hypothetical protein